MVSKSQEKFMVSMALVVGACQNMQSHYQDKNGCLKIKSMITDLKNKSNKLLNMAHGTFNQKQFDRVGKKIGDMCADGLENAESYQVYISMLIGIVSDLIVEIPKHSAKYVPLNELLKDIENIYSYFEQRTRQESFDISGLKLMESFNHNFKAA